MKETQEDKLTVLSLKEGKRYAAYDNGRKLNRTFRLNNGKLENDHGDQGGTYHGCSFVPFKASMRFEEIGDDNAPKRLFFLEEGTIYNCDHLHARVAKVGQHLFYVDRDNVPTTKLELSRLDLDAKFTPVAKTKVRPLLAEAGGDQVKAYWDGEKATQPDAPPVYAFV